MIKKNEKINKLNYLDKVSIKINSKINLYLNVSKNLRSDGYHEIKSIMQSISLSDELEFLVWPKDNSNNLNENNLNNGINISCDNEDIPLNEKNLVHKAANNFLEKFNLRQKYNILIKIKKSIPVSAGLAGGSSNAAATIIALNKIFNLKLTLKELEEIGANVGSDVPFCISGGTAFVEGRGEKINKLPDIPFYWVVVAINGQKFSSGDVYQRFDILGKQGKPKHDKLINNILNKDFKSFFLNIYNDLEKVVEAEDKMVAFLRNEALNSGALAAQMTGSGPAVFAICKDLITAKRVFQNLFKVSNKIFLAHTTSKSYEFLFN